ARRAALAIPLLLFSSFLVLGGVGFISTVSAYAYYSRDLPDPSTALEGLTFEQPSVIYDRTGQIELARFGELRRGQGLLDQPGLRHRRRRVRRPRHPLRPAAWCLHDHPAARPGQAAARV